MKAQTNFLFFTVKLIDYIFSAFSVKPFPIITISFFLLSIFVDELISTPNIVMFLPNLVPGNEEHPCLPNPIP